MNARQLYLVVEQRKKVQEQLGNGYPGFKVRCVRAVAQNVLLQGSYFWNGRNCNPIVKNLGVGVYEVSLEEPERVGK